VVAPGSRDRPGDARHGPGPLRSRRSRSCRQLANPGGRPSRRRHPAGQAWSLATSSTCTRDEPVGIAVGAGVAGDAGSRTSDRAATGCARTPQSPTGGVDDPGDAAAGPTAKPTRRANTAGTTSFRMPTSTRASRCRRGPPHLSRIVLHDFREDDAVVVASGGPSANQARPVHPALGGERAGRVHAPTVERSRDGEHFAQAYPYAVGMCPVSYGRTVESRW
jgi:hypothetical protein